MLCIINHNLKSTHMQISKLVLLSIILCFLFSRQNLSPSHPLESKWMNKYSSKGWLIALERTDMYQMRLYFCSLKIGRETDIRCASSIHFLRGQWTRWEVRVYLCLPVNKVQNSFWKRGCTVSFLRVSVFSEVVFYVGAKRKIFCTAIKGKLYFFLY